MRLAEKSFATHLEGKGANAKSTAAKTCWYAGSYTPLQGHQQLGAVEGTRDVGIGRPEVSYQVCSLLCQLHRGMEHA